MIPYVARYVPDKILNIFEKIKTVIHWLPEVEVEEDETGERIVSCAMLARAVAEFFPVDCKDGYFKFSGFRHSWVEPKKELFYNPYKKIIIDIYPWALIGGPIIVVSQAATPWYGIYIEDGLDAERFKSPWFLKSTHKVIESFKNIIPY